MVKDRSRSKLLSTPTRRLVMFKNVLVGVDGRPNGRDAIALASQLIDPSGKLTLAHVHSGELRVSHAISPEVVRRERESSKKLLEDQRAGANVDAELISIVSGTPGRGLHQQAEDQDADLLVVGSCSHGAFGRAMLGDDTRAALNGAPCAVAIASRGYAERAGGQAVRSPRSASHTTPHPRARRRSRSLGNLRRAPAQLFMRWKSSRSRPTPTPGSCPPRSARVSR